MEIVNDMAIRPFNILSICSGAIDALALGVELAVPHARVVCHVERDAFCAANLVRAMEEGCMVQAPVWSDARTFDGRRWRGLVDCIVAGYPCQPFSFAGKRRGTDDPRHLWPVIARIVGEVQPASLFFENVSGHLSLGFPEVCECLEGMGYQVAAGLFTAEEVGAPHRRERLFIMADHQRRRAGDQPEPDRGSEREHADTLATTTLRPTHGAIGSGWTCAGSGDVELAHPALGGLGELREPPGGDGQPDGGDFDVDHAQRADAGQGEQGEQGEAGSGRDRPAIAGGYVADAADSEGRRDEPERGQDRRAASGRAGEAMADAARFERLAESGGRRVRQAGEGLADPGGNGSPTGLSGPDTRKEGIAKVPDDSGDRLPIFPPGPADRDAWDEVLRADPTLEPALCVLAHGLADDRRHWLRALGNGVVPLQVAHAWRTLAAVLAGH